MPTASQLKRAAHKEKFRKIGAALTDYQRAWIDRLGRHEFEIKCIAVDDKGLSSRLFGPQTKTQQWERTTGRR